MKTIQLADFYNPTGDEIAEDAPCRAGTPKPKALLIVVSAVWCSPCNYEADVTLPALYAKYQPNGGEFFLVLADGPTPGIPAESKNLYLWDKKYALDYPSALDPSSKLAALFEADAFPAKHDRSDERHEDHGCFGRRSARGLHILEDLRKDPCRNALSISRRRTIT